jgi:gamma-glutamylcyclotransferase (GGCT)/AIG2-like uncharacterized protein YtfP
MSVEHRLVVYGSLAPGESNHHQMDGMTGTWTPGTVRGHFRGIGWGTDQGFPGLTPDPTGPQVAIQLFTSRDLPAHWARLDAFEGEDYRRVEIAVTVGGEVVAAYVYAVGLVG